MLFSEMEKLSWLAFIIFEIEGCQIFNATKDDNTVTIMKTKFIKHMFYKIRMSW